LDKWAAFDAVEPIGERWLQTAQLTTMVERLIEQNALHRGFDKFTPTTIENNMPPRYRREKATKQTATQPAKPASQHMQFHQLAASLGLSEVVIKHGRFNQSS
jgi:hypothetical protein